ncbi:hypothetical protein H7849_18025 [Alloacidobacterium dinghuense]|uniref:Uncharacterized protein n=1 Tax=Alloacidobacterium dinghuense TaxID=2763107 RepID=A0A7G8BEM5_9BACT|nr:hypothetical protein [Alloacidobacterium dinghuense]QNI30995.1 hypothetical protein H7849_18025 [Alloacidobacterium dinghuense]
MPVDPATLYLGKKAIDIALTRVEQSLREAKDDRRTEVERCASFLEACKGAIVGLEQEYDEIVEQTVNSTDDPTAIRELKKRIDDYLHIDKLRLQLIDATKGLEHYLEIFEQRATTVLQWPWKRPDKEKAVDLFRENLEQLDGYLDKLNRSDLPFRPSGTGVGLTAMFAILEEIERIDGPAPRRPRRSFPTSLVRELGKKYRSERDKEPLIEIVRRIRATIEEMRKAFL